MIIRAFLLFIKKNYDLLIFFFRKWTEIIHFDQEKKSFSPFA